MKIKSRPPMTILVHQLLRVPLNVMMVWIRPRMRITISVPGTNPNPQVSNVPPMTTTAMA
jgi:hypothetical protein